MSLLSVDLIDKTTSMKRSEVRGAIRALDAISDATVDQLGPRLRSAFRGLNEVQRAFTGIMFDLSLDLARTTVNLLSDEGEVDGHVRRPHGSMIGSAEYPE
jgi:hypothetical protein